MAFRLYQPMPRYNHNSGRVANKVIVYSGLTQNFSEDSRKNLASKVDVFYPHSEQWEPQKCTGESPVPGLHQAACVVVNNRLYTYGGRDGDDKFVDTLHQLSIETYQWSKLTSQNAKAETPMPKDGAAMAACGDNLALLGGFGLPHDSIQRGSSFMKTQNVDGSGWTNEFHIYDLNEGVWSTPDTTGERPPPCAAFTFTAIDNRRAVMYGGSNDDGEMSDVYIIDFQTKCWTKLSKSAGETWPEARSRHAACCLNYGKQRPQLLVVGGLSGKWMVLRDAWILDVDKGTWRKVKVDLQPRYGHSSDSINISSDLTEVTMFGGRPDFFGDAKLDATTVLQFRLKENSWELFSVVEPTELRQSEERLREKMKHVSVSADQHWLSGSRLRRYVRRARPTGNNLGSGTYGSVIELVSAGEVVAGKVFKTSHVEPVLDMLYGEMLLMMTIHHPNIVESKGVCFLDQPMPVLLMERMEYNLNAYLLHPSHQAMPLTAKTSILYDVASGLFYLHNHKPAVVHRDLTATNVLLSLELKAKIGDFGNARLMDLDPTTTPQTFTNLPGTIEYMPPEALGQRSHYGPSLDVFSFGHLALFTLIQSHVDLLPHSYSDDKGDHLRSELMRRETSMNEAEKELGENHILIALIKKCLHNDSALRPHTDDLVAELQPLTFVAEDQVPTLPELTCFKTSSDTINLAQQIGAEYKMLGIHLLEDDTGALIQSIITQYQLDAAQINIRIFQEWLSGKGKKPITWATLIKVLSEIQLCTLASKIKQNL